MPNYTLRRLMVALTLMVLVAVGFRVASDGIEVTCTSVPRGIMVQEGDTFWGLFHELCDGNVADLANQAAGRLDRPLMPGDRLVIGEDGRIVLEIEVSRVVHDQIPQYHNEVVLEADQDGESAVLVGQDVTRLVTWFVLHER